MAKTYTIVPSAVHPFDQLDALSRYCFGLIYDRWLLSGRKSTWRKWVDDEGLYCVYDQADLAKELGVSLPTVRRCLDALEAQNIIKRVRADKRGACRYYIKRASVRMAMGYPEAQAEINAYYA